MVASLCVPGLRVVEIHHKPATIGHRTHDHTLFTPYLTSVHTSPMRHQKHPRYPPVPASPSGKPANPRLPDTPASPPPP